MAVALDSLSRLAPWSGASIRVLSKNFFHEGFIEQMLESSRINEVFPQRTVDRTMHTFQSLFISLLVSSTAILAESLSERLAGSQATILEGGGNGTRPLSWGIVIFPGFDHLDVFGPIEYLNMISVHFPTNFSLIAQSLDPVSTKIPAAVLPAGMHPNIEQLILPSHTFKNAPPLDILIVPGGPGAEVEVNGTAVTDFVRERYPVGCFSSYISSIWLMAAQSLKYLLSVCTGSALLAKSGVLDGRKATSNKAGFAWVASQGPKVDWVTHARWVVDGNIWTSSGVTSGLDMMYNFTSTLYGEEMAFHTSTIIEYTPSKNSSFDPFADYWNVTQPSRGG
jgi:transcriptional regulator GlxA family with amidase domain